jgi:hypothetical protein
MKTLQAIIIATAIGASACFPPPYEPRQATPGSPATIEVTGVPTTEPERSTAAHSSNGSYTFHLKTTAPKEGVACAYRYGMDALEVHGKSTNQQLEYESSVIKGAKAEKQAVTFRSAGTTPQGCYAINSVPELK